MPTFRNGLYGHRSMGKATYLLWRLSQKTLVIYFLEILNLDVSKTTLIILENIFINFYSKMSRIFLISDAQECLASSSCCVVRSLARSNGFWR